MVNYRRRNSPEHLERRVEVFVPLGRGRDVVDPPDGGDGRKVGKPRRGEFRAFLNAEERRGNGLRGGVVRDGDDHASRERRIVAPGEIAGGSDEGGNGALTSNVWMVVPSLGMS